jgi:hypothetical protein
LLSVPGPRTPVFDDAQDAVLYSITKQCQKARDGLDHRGLIELTNDLIHHSLAEVRVALAELADSGLIHKQSSRTKGEGWAPCPQAGDKLGISKISGMFLTSAVRRYEARHQTSGIQGVSSDGGHQTSEDIGTEPPGSVLSFSYSQIAGADLRTGTDETVVIRGEFIERKRRAPASPNSPQGLATYFQESAREKGFVWGETNQRALWHWFKTALEAGMSADDVRKLINVFFLHPEAIRGAGKSPWRQFLNQREALAKQAGVRSHQHVPTRPAATTPDEMEAERRRILGDLLEPQEEMTAEEMAADRARIMAGVWAQ